MKNTQIMLVIILISFGLFAHQNNECSGNSKLDNSMIEIKQKQTERRQSFEPGSIDSRDSISDLIDLLDINNLTDNVLELTNFDTRYYAADNRYEVAGWINDKFLEFGFEQENVVTDSFYTQNEWHRNVYGIIPGTIHPDKYIIVSGHYDSISETPMSYAPGADDNSSSVSAILEMARVMLDQNYQPDVSLMFTLFGSKEPGRYGSEYLTEKMILDETDLLYAINLEMLGFNTNNPEDWTISFNRYTGSEFLYDFLVDTMNEYTSLNAGTTANNYNYYDCWNFYQNGFNVTMFTAEEFNMSAHSTGDIIDNIDFLYMTELSKLACASLAQLSILPQSVEGISVYDDGSGNGLFLTWSPSEDTDFDHFEIGYGIESGFFTESITTTGTEILLFGLTEGQEYFIGLRAVDTDNNTGFYTEVQGTSNQIPQIPEGFKANPSWDGVFLEWLPSMEMDIAGYWIYRSDSPEGTYSLLNNELMINPEYLDESVLNGILYYYKISSEDFDGYQSELTDFDRSRRISLDQGILLVDDTTDGSGGFMQPTDEECDQFYEEILEGFTFDVIDSNEMEEIRMDDLCIYSSVVWYIDDNMNQSDIYEYQNEIRLYLEAGGQLLLAGFKIVSNICDINGFPYYFQEGDFGWDILKLSSVDLTNAARFNSAVAVNGIDIFVDESKTLEAMDFHLIGVEAVELNSGNNNYTFGCGYEVGSPFAVLSGLPVDSFYNGDDYKLALFTFPFYYMNFMEVSELLHSILTDYFGEQVSAEDNGIPNSSKVTLKQNYPNPFNPVTTIEFNLNFNDKTVLEIFDLKGQRVK
jgi:Peptidase family M28